MFFNKAAVKHWEKLTSTLSNLWFGFTAAVTTKAVIYKLFSLNCFMLFALKGLYWVHKKTVDHFFHWRKISQHLLQTYNSSAYYLEIIPACNISKVSKYHSPLRGLWYFGQFLNITHGIIAKYHYKSCYYLYLSVHWKLGGKSKHKVNLKTALETYFHSQNFFSSKLFHKAPFPQFS